MIKCGMAEVVITPTIGYGIPGYLEERKSTGIKDELYAKAMVMDDGERIAALISADVADIEREDVLNIRERVFALTGISQNNIMICATHTHTGGPVINSYRTPRNEEYTSLFVEKAGDSAYLAFKRLKPVRIGSGSGVERDISFNRRYFMKDGSVRTNPGVGNPFIDKATGPIDPEVTVIRIDDMEGNAVGVVTNFACHLDVVGGTEYCADYSGELGRIMKRMLGEESVSIFLTGASGNINHLDTSVNIELGLQHYKKMGRILAGEVIKVREKIEVYNIKNIGVRRTVFNINTRSLSDNDIKKAEEIMRLRTEESIDKVFANEIIMYENNKVKEVEVEVQAITVGKELCIVALPGDVFTEFGLDIKSKSPYKYNMISTHSNGRNGYIPVREAFEQGGYEIRTTRSNKLVADAGYIMVENLMRIL